LICWKLKKLTASPFSWLRSSHVRPASGTATRRARGSAPRLGNEGDTLEMKEEDRRKEYESLRTELRGADLSCQLIVATLATITGAIILNWISRWYAGLAIQVIWLFGIMYFAERRFAITRIARYIREHIEKDDSGFAYETVINNETKRPPFLPSPLYREIALGVIVSLFIPVIIKLDSNDTYPNIMFWISLIIGIGIAILGFKLCVDYKKFKNH